MRPIVRWAAVAACALAAIAVAYAQEPKPTEEEQPPAAEEKPQEESREVRFFAELGYWMAQPVGLDYFPATVEDPTNPSQSSFLSLPFGTTPRARYRFGYRLPQNAGEFVLTWWSQSDDEVMFRSDPGNFGFGEVAVQAAGAGIFDDGLADAFTAETSTVTRDLRLDFYRDAFDAPRAKGRWFVGLRRVTHKRTMNVDYLALAANLPLVIDPDSQDIRVDLLPGTDTATIFSSFTGQGIEAGFDLVLPIHKRVWVETGVAIAILRGETDANHNATTNQYVLVSGDVIVAILLPPFDELNDPTQTNDIRQVTESVGFTQSSVSTTADVLETYLGFRARVWRNLEGFLGIRNVQYGNVGTDLGLTANTAPNDHSVGYEGYYLGVSYRY